MKHTNPSFLRYVTPIDDNMLKRTAYLPYDEVIPQSDNTHFEVYAKEALHKISTC